MNAINVDTISPTIILPFPSPTSRRIHSIYLTFSQANDDWNPDLVQNLINANERSYKLFTVSRACQRLLRFI
jgi:hypothetical protein